MHLLTGLVLGEMLLGSKLLKGRGKRPPFEIIHTLPGRLRVRVGCLQGDADAAAALVERLGALEGVKEVSADARTASVLIRFDDTPDTREAIVATLAVASGADREEQPAVPAGQPTLLTQLGELGRVANAEVLAHSGGLADLETLFAAGCGLYGLKTLLLPGLTLSRWHGMTLMYWSYNIMRRRLAG
ncbi:MAG: hypothetical protein CSB49_08510 [Proteobacteria bacterium]|nr:MAG: hypothetical protein CSB49_08510 [Pseudomonadota bacterium]